MVSSVNRKELFYMSIFGERLLEARKRQRITQGDLADRAGVTRSAIGGYETMGKDASYEVLVKIARALGVTTDYLLGLDDNTGWHKRTGVAEKFYDLELLYDRASDEQKAAMDGLLIEADKLLSILMASPDVVKLGHVRDILADTRRLMGDVNE